jgi:hypothetical protein
MKKLTVLFLFTLSFWVSLSAQDIEGWINSRKPVLFEKLYLHVDRELYAPGDIIWLKAYQVNGVTHQLNSNFRNIFVQLVAEDGRVVKDLILFSFKGQAKGSFKTDSLPDGNYTIRAFTKYLENFGEEALFHQKIRIEKTLNTIKPGANGISEHLKIEVAFLPEGGNLVLNTANTVAFKAIDQKGRGVSISGKILDDLGDTITSFSTSYLGMGKFLMMPVDDRTYFATIDRYPEMKIKLEPALTSGIALNYSEKGNYLKFVMSSNMKLNPPGSFYFVASYKGIDLYHSKIEMDNFTQRLVLNKSLFPKGISKITLLDSTLNQIAEQLIFVDNGNVDLINLKLSKTEFEPREEVNIGTEVLLPPDDSITSTMSVSVVNKNYFGPGGNSQNIKSYLLLDSDLKGAIESPASYFIDDEAISSTEKLNLLMLVNGWRSYFWDDIEANKTAGVNDWNDAGFEIKGYTKKILWETPLADAKVLIGTVYGNFIVDSVVTNEQGRFKFERICVMESIKMMLNARTKNGTRNVEIRLDPATKKSNNVSVDSLKNTCFDVGTNMNFSRANSLRQMKELGFNPEKGSILLSGVDVVEKKQLIDDGHFRIYSEPDNSLTVTKEEAATYLNVIDYLVGKVAGLTIKIAGLTDTEDEVSIRGGGMPLFLVDGFEVTGSDVLREIRNIRMNEIDKVEVLKNGGNMAIFGSKGGNGVIAIYRKTASQMVPDSTSWNIKGRTDLKMKGFHRARKFYSPTYILDNKNNPKPDYRPTLFWNPDLEFDNGKANINFYTSDELAQYVVFVEGISKAGKICYGTTSFTVK